MGDRSSVISLADGLTKIAGSHTLKAGLYLEYQGYLQRHNGGGNFPGNIQLQRKLQQPFGYRVPVRNRSVGLLQYLCGVGYQTSGPQTIRRATEWYVQDSWKVSKNLTLDYGVRFAYDLKVYDKTNVGGNFEPALYNRSQTATLYIPAKNAQGTEWPKTLARGLFILLPTSACSCQDPANTSMDRWRLARRVSARILRTAMASCGLACGLRVRPVRRWKDCDPRGRRHLSHGAP